MGTLRGTGLQIKRSLLKPWPGTTLCSWGRHLALIVTLSTRFANNMKRIDVDKWCFYSPVNGMLSEAINGLKHSGIQESEHPIACSTFKEEEKHI